MQNRPGANNGLPYRGRPLTNWWTSIGNSDEAMATGLGWLGEHLIHDLRRVLFDHLLSDGIGPGDFSV